MRKSNLLSKIEQISLGMVSNLRNSLSDQTSTFAVFMVAIIATSAVFMVNYPGFMSYDSLHALREARAQVQGGAYTPFPAYVWRVFDWILPGPTLMLFAQNFVLFFSLGMLARHLSFKLSTITIILFSLYAVLPISGTLLVVWKDGANSACLAASLILMLIWKKSSSAKYLYLSILFLFFAAAYRYNSISGVLPLIGLISVFHYQKNLNVIKSTLIGTFVLFFLVISVTLINSFRFPTFEKLNRNDSFEYMMFYDLLAMSHISKKNLMPYNIQDGKPIMDAEYLEKIYDFKWLGIVFEKDTERKIALLKYDSPDQLRKIFIKALKEEPRAYFKHRTRVFKELLGMHNQMLFPTLGLVAPNEFGITHTPSKITKKYLEFVEWSSWRFIGKPYFYYILGFISLIGILYMGGLANSYIAITAFLSGALYLLPFYFITPGADLRYNHWSIIAALIVILNFFSELRNLNKDQSAKPVNP